MKKIVNFMISMIFICLITSVISYAESIDGDLSYEEGGKVYTPTVEDMMIKINKEAKYQMNNFQEKVRLYVYPDRNQSYLLSVKRFIQERDYYCAPSTVKQVIHFLEGSSKSQDYYAQRLGTTSKGTDMTVIPKVLNDELGERKYFYDGGEKTIQRWELNIISALRDNVPPILDIKIKNTKENVDFMGYSTDGHFLSVFSYEKFSNGEILIGITDPCSKSKPILVKSDILHKFNMEHFRKAMIW